MKNKTLFVSCATLGSGGAERVMSILSKPFADEYERVEYILWLHHPLFYTINERIKIVDITKEVGTNNIFKKMWWFRGYVKKERPDLILSFLWPWSMKVLLSLLFTQHKVVVAERQDPRVVKGGMLMRGFRSLLYKKADGIVVQTEANSNSYHGDVEVIYNPVSMPLEKIGVALRTEKKNRFVSVGRLIPQKNHELMVRAFAEFYKKHTNYELVIFGEGELRKSLEQLAYRLGIGSALRMPGNSADVVESISDATAFLLSSDYEGMPNALLEAMCVGLPCVSTKVSGATDLILSGTNGILIDLRSVEQMAEAMRKLADDAKLCEQMGREATKVYERLRPDIINKKWIDYINRKIEEKIL